MTIRIILISSFITFTFLHLVAQSPKSALNDQQKSMIIISALTAKGDLNELKKELSIGLDAGLTIHKIKECIVHAYAYCGFPRSIRGLQTFMEVLEERKIKGIVDTAGAPASDIEHTKSKYERGRDNLERLSGVSKDAPKAGYAVFSPEIEVMLKEHLFADLFDRDVLSYEERELVTISVISAIGNAEPMLKSHLNISLKNGISPDQLHEFVQVIHKSVGRKEAKAAKAVLQVVLNLNK
jgi:4-carboxymuconolactone decarboxylase